MGRNKRRSRFANDGGPPPVIVDRERRKDDSKAPEKVGCDEIDSRSKGAEATEHMDYKKKREKGKMATVLGKTIEPKTKLERETEVDAGK